MCQQGLLAAVAGEAEFLHHFILFRGGHRGTVEVGALSVGISLELLEATLVVEPLVCQEFAAVHATNRNDHGAVVLYPGGGKIGVSPLRPLRLTLPLRNPRHPQKHQNMSATLFGRGVMTQVGGRQRAEATEKAISTLRAELAELATLPTQMRAMEARLQASDRKVAALEAEVDRLKAAAAAPAPAPAASTT